MRPPHLRIKVRFSNSESERKALGFLAGRFPFKTYADGYTLFPEAALARLAGEGIVFSYFRLRAAPLVSKVFRRFEILLPLRFNDGRPVPDELIADTLLELR